MANQFPPEEKILKPPGSFFFLVVSYDLDETYFRIKEFAESQFSKSLYESVPMPKWMLPEWEKNLYQTGSSTRILSFERRINREELPSHYKECINISKKLRKKDPSLRLVPGYLSSQNVVIGSTIDDLHRIYLFHGIFAEIIYKYQKSQLVVSDTAPQFFHTRESIYFFTNLRESYEYFLKKHPSI
ncbi:DUF4416 family protein [Leptospira sp. GIMC2001]|uniref:DUF4416 family protein n=1 Tax=Leptospira sp. GIMC2001 TaxID=1513297 RepID=UPI0023492C73|nr:DUF4416 family protein [Leptospira sp. GIMC2001]WCL48028.1 DUF4416 family protein [Leptospira sp. GIMC2001]